jgi:hypothetical protein
MITDAYPMGTPGSDEARAAGCLCPVLDNAHGRGAYGLEGGEGALFWCDTRCPLHGVRVCAQRPTHDPARD